MRKSLMLIPVLFVFINSISAQFQGGGASGVRRGGQQMNIGRFYGKVVDAKTNKGIDAVSIQLMQSKVDTATKKRKDSLVAGMLTRKTGDFSLENLPVFGNYTLTISAIGYTPIERKVSFDLRRPQGGDMSQALAGVDKDLGNIKLEQDAKLLEAVTVSASRSLSLGIDRKVFNVEKNITSAGGTAVDVMKNVPSLSVDIDGNVTLRNNAPQIFVDGRPTTLSLDQIPADAIQSVEIITNPSAKFDASGGTSGILNIVLKKNRKAGYNGSLRAGIDQRGKFNLGGDINVRQGKVNFFANANYGQRKSVSTGETDRLTLINNPNTQLLQYDRNQNIGYFAFGRAGFDFFVDNRNTITFSGMMVNGKFKPSNESDIYVDTLYPTGKTSSFTERLSNTTGEFRNKRGEISYKHLFAEAGKEWTADINYNRSRNENHNTVSTSIYNQVGGPLSNRFQQLIDGNGENEFLTLQTDFTDPITENSKIEYGARMQLRDIQSANEISFVSSTGSVTKIPQLSSEYANKDKVYAAYVTYSNKIKDFGYMLGLRVESSDYKGDVQTTTQNFKDTTISYSNNYPFSLFPSVFLTQKLKNQQELQFNFTRRINRPNFFQLFPFTDYSDSLNLSRGNPDLTPEFTYSSEISYQKIFKNNSSILTSLYFKFTDNLITRFQVKETNPVSDKEVLVNTFVNANSSYVGGMEFIFRNPIAKWWDVTSNLNLFTSRINIVDSSLQQQDNIYSWFVKINNSFKLPKNFSVQLSGEYQSKTVLPPGGSGSGGGGFGGGGGRGGGGFGQAGTSQGYMRPNFGVDGAIRFEFLAERRASISLSVSDIFRTRKNDVFSQSIYFVQNSERRRDPQFFRLNFNWRFGKFDVSLFKRKNMRGDSDGMEGVQQ